MNIFVNLKINDPDQRNNRGNAKVRCCTPAKKEYSNHDEDRIRQDAGVVDPISIIHVKYNDDQGKDAQQ